MIQKEVWEKLTPISREEYNRHVNAANSPSYPILTIDCKTGCYAYHTDDPPNFVLLEQAIKKGIWENK